MSQSAFFLMHNPLQHYDWGSHDAMTRLFGLPNPDAQPQAELWMGAHPNGCSRLETPQGAIRLDGWIAAAPEQALGHTTAARFGRLPFLFKVLAAEKALSIQVHPSKQQAEAGFARENAAGVALNASHRNYRDDNHKPELVFALTPYQAMNGFRPISEIQALFARVAIPALTPLIDALAAYEVSRLDSAERIEDRDAAVQQMVIGQVVFGQLLLSLRRIGHEHHSSLRFLGEHPEDTETAQLDGADH